MHESHGSLLQVWITLVQLTRYDFSIIPCTKLGNMVTEHQADGCKMLVILLEKGTLLIASHTQHSTDQSTHSSSFKHHPNSFVRYAAMGEPVFVRTSSQGIDCSRFPTRQTNSEKSVKRWSFTNIRVNSQRMRMQATTAIKS